jgi:UDP-N-acetylglucosamine--N-acetylmuramyl-(pentapeptide) pyrophosphoryl-undecaprenol N-acetylglucosamine transferase
MKLLLAGGGTGGHLFPAIALAEQLKYEEPQSEILFVGTERGLEARMLPELGWPLETIDMSGYAGQGVMAKVMVLGKLMKSLMQSRKILQHFQPDVVVGVGGYASVPALLSAKTLGVPYLVHEQNAWPGMANRLLGRWAKRVCLSLAEADRAFHRSATVLTGNPVRSTMENCPSIDDDKTCLLIFGGSQGARAINRTMIAALPYLEEWKGTLEIIHQSGGADFEETVKGYEDNNWPNVEILPFIKDMSSAYAKSTLIVCRAGATTLAELTACGRPAVLVPYPHATAGHQSGNAQAMAAKGAALMMEEADLTPERLAQLINGLLHDRTSVKSMAAAAKALAQRGAAARLLKECRSVLEEAQQENQ